MVAPATVADAFGMLKTALADPDPVLFFEHGALATAPGELPEAAGPLDIDKAAIRRAGQDITLITYGGTLPTTLAAAEELSGRGVDAEVIDLRTLRPLDDATFVNSVRRTHRAVVVDEGGAAAASPRRSPHVSPSRRSTSWTRRSAGCAARRCPRRTRVTWSRRRSPAPGMW